MAMSLLRKQEQVTKSLMNISESFSISSDCDGEMQPSAVKKSYSNFNLQKNGYLEIMLSYSAN